MVIHFQHNPKDKQHTQWIIMKVPGTNYTKAGVDKVRKYLAENVNPGFANVKDEAIKGCYTGKYDDAEFAYDEKYDSYELRTRSSFSSNYAKDVTVVELN